MMDRSHGNEPGRVEPTLTPDERALEERLRGVPPAPLSSHLRARLEGSAAQAGRLPSRWDVLAKRVLPWACAACLALGFVLGAQMRAPGTPATPIGAPTAEGPPAADASRLVLTGSSFPDERAAPYRVVAEGEPGGGERPSRSDDDVPRLGAPFTSS
jgi:hypothetical protein